MGINPRLTAPMLQILAILLRDRGEKSGAQIANTTKIASGTLYPILIRLEKAGWLESRWETEDPSDLQRPRRRYYQLTGLGSEKAKEAIQDITTIVGEFSWSHLS